MRAQKSITGMWESTIASLGFVFMFTGIAFAPGSIAFGDLIPFSGCDSSCNFCDYTIDEDNNRLCEGSCTVGGPGEPCEHCTGACAPPVHVFDIEEEDYVWSCYCEIDT